MRLSQLILEANTSPGSLTAEERKTISYLNINGMLKFKYIPSKEKTYAVCKYVVSQNGYTLQYVNKQTPDICLAAVEQNGMALEYVKKQTPEICLTAVQRNADALEFVNKQTPEICMAAIRSGGCALRFVHKQTPEMCMAAVMDNGVALHWVAKQTPELCMAAVKQTGMVIELVKNQTPEICLAAVKQNVGAARFIKNRTPEIYLVMCKKYDWQLGSIRNLLAGVTVNDPWLRKNIDKYKKYILKSILNSIHRNIGYQPGLVDAHVVCTGLKRHNIHWSEIDAILQSLNTNMVHKK
jgi:hypothetical protein